MPDNPLTPPSNIDENTVELYQKCLNLEEKIQASMLEAYKIKEKTAHLDHNVENMLIKNQALKEQELKNIKAALIEQKHLQQQIESSGVRDKALERQYLNTLLEKLSAHNHILKTLEMEEQLIISKAEHEYAMAHKYGNFMKTMLSEIFSLQIKEYDQIIKIGDALNKYPYSMGEFGYAIGTVIVYLKTALDVFLKFDKAAWEFRKTMGITREYSRGFEQTSKEIAIHYMDLGVTIDGVYASTMALGHQMGSINSVSKELVTTTSLLSAQLGISEETTAGVFRNMAAISKSSMEAQQNTVYMSTALASAAGVNLGDVMKDIASKSTETLTMMSRIPSVILKSSIELRKMGSSLGEAAKSSRQLLNFSESVDAEMTAAVLIGKSINLQKARELAYHRDLEGSTREILRITKQIDFSNLDVFQQEAFAHATGKSVDELLKMIQAEKQLNNARNDPKLAGRVAEYDRLKNINQANAKALGESAENSIKTLYNQERMTAITLKWQQILTQISEIMFPIIDNLLAITPPIIEMVKVLGYGYVGFKTIQYSIALMNGSLAVTKGLSLSLSSIWGKLFKTKGLGGAGGIAENITKGLETEISKAGTVTKGTEEVIKNISKNTASLGKTIQSFLGGIGRGIGNAIEGILGGVARGIEAFGNKKVLFGAANIILLSGALWVFGQSIQTMSGLDWKSLLIAAGALVVFTGAAFGLGALLMNPVGLALFSTGLVGFTLLGAALLPFAHSAKMAGEGMVMLGNGFTSLVTGFKDLSTMSFVNTISQLSKLVDAIKDVSTEIKAMPSLNIEKFKTLDLNFPNGISSNNNANNNNVPVKQEIVGDERDNNSTLLKNILDAINILNKNLESGKIGIHMDGSLLSTTLVRNTEFRGSFGTNT